MAMSERTMDAKYAGARFFGVLFQLLAVVTLLGTLFATAEIANLGNRIQISGAIDPVAGIVFVSGLFASCVLAGLGYTLGVLCAIYDRQEPAVHVVDVAPRVIDRNSSPEPDWYRPRPTTFSTKGAPAPAPPVNTADAPTQELVSPPVGPVSDKSSLWEWLTRERHFRQSESE